MNDGECQGEGSEDDEEAFREVGRWKEVRRGRLVTQSLKKAGTRSRVAAGADPGAFLLRPVLERLHGVRVTVAVGASGRPGIGQFDHCAVDAVPVALVGLRVAFGARSGAAGARLRLRGEDWMRQGGLALVAIDALLASVRGSRENRGVNRGDGPLLPPSRAGGQAGLAVAEKAEAVRGAVLAHGSRRGGRRPWQAGKAAGGQDDESRGDPAPAEALPRGPVRCSDAPRERITTAR